MLTATGKRARRERRQKYQTIFINGKQKRVLRLPTIEGLSVDEFIAHMPIPSGCTRTRCGKTFLKGNGKKLNDVHNVQAIRILVELSLANSKRISNFAYEPIFTAKPGLEETQGQSSCTLKEQFNWRPVCPT
ncbi:MAG: hypothetical protein MI757_02250 [Pirellulales bacterium]|nr:hypothetical protein [Pirellulales bacterium]